MHPASFITRWVRLCVCCALLWLMSSALLAQDNPNDAAQIMLPDAFVRVGEEAVIDVLIDCQAVLCSAFSVDLRFNPAMLRVDAVTLGGYLGEQVVEIQEVIDNQAGALLYAATMLGTPSSSEQNILFKLHVTGIATGETTLTLTHLIVGDDLGMPLTSRGQDGAIVVCETPALEVLVRQLNVRREPTTRARVLGTAARGEQLAPLALAGSGAGLWYQVSWGDVPGWVHSSGVGLASEACPVTTTLDVTTETVASTPVPPAAPTAAPNTNTDAGGQSGEQSGGSAPPANTPSGPQLGLPTPPPQPLDLDGDGIPDAQDVCPAQFGSGNGCPQTIDSDGDGLADGSDACPSEYGLPSSGGCPSNSDGDGVFDHLDECPFEYGTTRRGCP